MQLSIQVLLRQQLEMQWYSGRSRYSNPEALPKEENNTNRHVTIIIENTYPYKCYLQRNLEWPLLTRSIITPASSRDEYYRSYLLCHLRVAAALESFIISVSVPKNQLINMKRVSSNLITLA
jgi:hypothetical protein